MSKVQRRPRVSNQSIHPNGRDMAKTGKTTAPRRKREATTAHRLHCEQHPADGMSSTRLALLDKGAV
jgi:hypothetical protein